MNKDPDNNNMITVHTGPAAPRVPEAVLFPFDEFAVPFRRGMRLELQSCTREGVVIAPGPPGTVDTLRIQYYGTVIRIGDELRMWYLGIGDREGEDGVAHQLKVCYATSRDGVHWEKPELGLVEYGGDSKNNRVLIRGMEETWIYAAVVLHEPEDPDPNRRWKMAIEIPDYDGQLAIATSADGLDWQASPANPVGPLHEFSGLTKFNGCYYLAGQGATGYGREMEVLASYDFEHWTMAPAIGLSRKRQGFEPNRTTNRWIPPVQIPQEREIHIGASLWNRGNVILAVFGDWRWDPRHPGDRQHVTIDLGLLTSPDAIHYREPSPDIPLMVSSEQWKTNDDWDSRLIQGQGFENIGDKTLFWYMGAKGGVHLATWPRDRIGGFRMEEHALHPHCSRILGHPHFITCPITAGTGSARVFLNVDLGNTSHAEVTVELCDEQFRPLPDYSGDNAATVAEPGLRVPVKWKATDAVPAKGQPFRIRVNYGGIRTEDVRVFAVYVG
jgi:hypothetical protein